MDLHFSSRVSAPFQHTFRFLCKLAPMWYLEYFRLHQVQNLSPKSVKLFGLNWNFRMSLANHRKMDFTRTYIIEDTNLMDCPALGEGVLKE